MRSNDEPLAITPSSPTVEPPQFPIATVDQGREMENIWQMVNMVTPTTGTNSTSLKKYWQEFMSRFRHFEMPLDESRALMVICHIPLQHLTKGHGPKEVFSLFLDERAFSVWSVELSIDGVALLFRTHALCRVRPDIRAFTVMVNALPDIALTGLSDWQQAQAMMVNTYQKLNPNSKATIPFQGLVYPAELVLKTTRLEEEVARQKKELAESAQRIQKLLEENTRAAALATQQALNAAALQEAEDETGQSYAALHEKQKRIEALEFAMHEQQRQLTEASAACSSREAAQNDATKRRLEELQGELESVKAAKARLEVENRRARSTWGGQRISAADLAAGEGAPPSFPPEILSMMQRQDRMMETMMAFVQNMPAQAIHAPAPPIITVVATQTDAKKVALQRVQAILQLFDPSLRAQAWKVSERGPSGEILSYDMERAMDRVRDIIVARGGRFAELPSKAFLSNCSLLLFDYAGEGLTLEDFNAQKPKKIGESFDRFTQAFLHMVYILTEYVHPSLGHALNSLYVNLLNIKTAYPRLKVTALTYVTQQLLGRLRQMDEMPSQEAVTAEVAGVLRLVEGSPMFQPLINRELMGEIEGGKRSRDSDNTPPEAKKARKGTVPTRPQLQGAPPCYSWIKQLDCCKGPACNAPKKKGAPPAQV